MRWQVVLREAGRNLSSGTTRAVSFMVALSALVLSLQFVELSAVAQVVRGAEDFRASGAAVVTLSADGRIDGAGCAALGGLPGVSSAGALRSAGEIVPAGLPSSTVPVIEVTQGIADLMNPEPWGVQGVLVSAQVGDALDIEQGGELATTSGSVPISGQYTYPDDGRRPGYGYAVLAPVAAEGAFDECWVDIWPVPENIGSLIGTALRPSGERSTSDAVLSQLNTRRGTRFTAGDEFEARLSRYFPAAAAMVGFVLGWLSIRIRRAQLSSDLHHGVSRIDAAAIAGVEFLSWATAAVAGVIAVDVLIIVRGSADAIPASAALAARILLCAVTATCLGAVAAFAGTRESHLTRYVRDR